MAGENPSANGLMLALRRAAATALAIVENRLELAVVEFGIEKLRVIEACFLGAIFFFLGLLGVFLLTLSVVLLCGENIRLYVLVGFGLFYLVGAAVALLALRQRIQNWPPPFADTISEIKKDCQCLQPPKS